MDSLEIQKCYLNGTSLLVQIKQIDISRIYLFIFGKNMFSLEETFTIESVQPAV